MSEVTLEALSFGTLSNTEIRSNDTELFKAGSGPDLLFLHGMDGIEGAAALLRTLSANFTVYAPSHPGFGASALPSDFSAVDDLGYFYLDSSMRSGWISRSSSAFPSVAGLPPKS